MMSRAFYFKLTMNGMKRRLWYGAVVFLMFFLTFPLNMMLRVPSGRELLEMGSNLYAIEFSRACQTVSDIIGGGDYLAAFMIAAAAFIGAWTELSWMHSKKKMDMMGSLPIRREKLVMTEFVTTFLLFFAAYLVNQVIAVFIGAANGYVTADVWMNALKGMGIHIVYFTALYFCAAAAMLMTGKILTGILVTGLIVSILPIIYVIFQLYPNIFFETYVESTAVGHKIMDWTAYLSPIGNLFYMTAKRIEQIEQLQEGVVQIVSIGKWIALAGGIGVIAFLLSIWMIKIRPSEAAEQSIAFPRIEGALKAIILYPAALLGGLLFLLLGSITSARENHFWLWFGILFFLVVESIVIEVIYHFDRKRIFGHKIWTMISAVAAIVTAAFFVYDIGGYDKWIPNQEEVEYGTACSMSDLWRYDNYPDGEMKLRDYLPNHIEQFQIPEVYMLAQNGVENLGFSNGDTQTIQVFYQMKNGKKEVRQYEVDRNVWLEAKKTIFQREGYRSGVWPLLVTQPELVKIESIQNFDQSMDVSSWTDEEMQEFVRIYQQELKTLDYSQIYTRESGTIILSYTDHYGTEYPINKNFTATVAFLQAKNVNISFSLDELSIQNIVFYDYGYGMMEGLYGKEEVKEGITKTMTDPEQIAQARTALLPLDLRCAVGFEIIEEVEYEDQLDVTVVYRGKNGQTFQCNCCYPKGMVPSVVREFLAE
ncbi:MAG: DUF6449 domain-containing protein [Candidatus Fimimorpha sp.]